MKDKILLSLTLVLAASTSMAGYLDKDTQSVRLDYVYDDEAGTEAAHGGEIGFGSSLYAFDDVSVFFYYADNSDMQAQRLGLSMEQYWRIPNTPLLPFAGFAAGWGWMDPINRKETDSLYLGFEGGLNVQILEWLGVSGSVEYLWSDKDLFLRDDFTRDDGDWNFKLGVRFYY